VSEDVVHRMLAATEPGSAPIDWDGVEAWLGTPLPRAYREIADQFGSLYVGDWLWVHAPVQLVGHPPLDGHMAASRYAAREVCEHSGLPEPVFHPAPGGLLPFGSGRGGEGLFWDTSAGSPDDWTVVALARAGWIRTGLTLVPFLGALVTTGVGEGAFALGPYPATAERAYRGAAATAWDPPVRAALDDPRRAGLTDGTGLAALQVLVPPPNGHGAAAGASWPADYRALMAAYGEGAWRGWLQLRHPDDLGPDGDEGLLEVSAGMREDDFVPFADTIDGDVLGWVRRGDPDAWPLAWVPRHADPGPAVATTLTDALLAWLRGNPVDEVFIGHDPDVDLLDQATFEPYGRA
jgi:hypothetical protein